MRDVEEDDEQFFGDGELLIRSYGLHWMRDAVDWSSKKLLGHRRHYKITVKNKTRKEKLCDVWPQRGIYALYQDFKLVYVGMAASSHSSIGSRLQAHTEKPRMRKRWDSFSWFGVDSYDAGDASVSPEKTGARLSPDLIARTLELVVILIAEPPMNRSQGRFKGSEQIIQAPSKDPIDFEASTTRTLHNIEQLLKQLSSKR